MTLRRQLAIVRAYSLLIVAAMIVAAVPVYLYANGQPRVYEASSTLIVGSALDGPGPDYNDLQVAQYLSRLYAMVATNGPVMSRVAERLGWEGGPGALAGHVFVTPSESDALITVTAQESAPERAAALADAVAAELVAVSPGVQADDIARSVEADLTAVDQEIGLAQAELERLRALPVRSFTDDGRIDGLIERLATLRATRGDLLQYARETSVNRLSVIRPAAVPGSPIAPRPLFLTMAAAGAGLLLAIALAFLLEYRRDRIRDVEGVRDTVGLPVLGTVPAVARRLRRGGVLAPWEGKDTSLARSFRGLRAGIDLAHLERPIGSIVIASPGPAEGRTSTAANLAIAFARSGRRVVLVDADQSRPMLHHLFGVPASPGWSDLLRGDRIAIPELSQVASVPGLWILPAGTHADASSDLPSPSRIADAVGRITSWDALVIYDTEPMDTGPTAAVLASHAEATILVVRAGRSTRAALGRTAATLSATRAHVAGVVVHGVPAGPAPSVGAGAARPPAAATDDRPRAA